MNGRLVAIRLRETRKDGVEIVAVDRLAQSFRKTSWPSAHGATHFILVNWNEMSVDPDTPPVKRRTYNVSVRRDNARRAHGQLLDAAQHRFLQHGYASTTIESIAADTDLSAATIYKAYGGKAGLARALCERALAGEGAIPAEQRAEALRDAVGDAVTLVRGWGRLVAEVSPRIAPLLLLLRDASGQDPAAAALYEEIDQARIARMRSNARHLASAGYLREDVDLQDACDALWLYTSPDIYDLLVRRRKWSVQRYSGFVTDALIAALLKDAIFANRGQ
jgi:AcrR family transcriptional regulator